MILEPAWQESGVLRCSQISLSFTVKVDLHIQHRQTLCDIAARCRHEVTKVMEHQIESEFTADAALVWARSG